MCSHCVTSLGSMAEDAALRLLLHKNRELIFKNYECVKKAPPPPVKLEFYTFI